MENTGKQWIAPVPDGKFFDLRQSLRLSEAYLMNKIKEIFLKRGILLFILGFLLGRAFILSELAPFSLPFLAAISVFQAARLPLVFIGVESGALSVSVIHAITLLGSIFFFFILKKMTRPLTKENILWTPGLVFVSLFAGKLIVDAVKNGGVLPFYFLMAAVEAGLGFVLTYIFLQAIPLFAAGRRRQPYKTEEIVCMIILFASMLTGMIDWKMDGLSVANIFARYLILIFSFTAGAAIGSTVGVVTGLIFGLADIGMFSEMSLLAFAGLLGGLLKDGKRFGVAAGLFIATMLIGVYRLDDHGLSVTLYESAAAIMLFFMTPKSFTAFLAKNIPGTPEHALEQQQYLRNMRDVTAKRVEQYSSIFLALAKSFGKQERNEERDEEVDYFLSNVTENSCQTCFKKEQCWVKDFHKTYGLMKTMMNELNEEKAVRKKIRREWDRHCIKSGKVLDLMQKELHFYQANQKLKKQVRETRKLVADQLYGVSKVMGNFALEIQKERENLDKQEEQIFDCLKNFGIDVGDVEIYSLEEGNVDIDITIPYCDGMGQNEKLIAPLLSDILGETIIVYSENCPHVRHEYCKATFRSAKAYVVETGVAHAAYDGGFLSGDSFSMIELGRGKLALAISDGMGNGEKAHRESQETLDLLKKILQSGIDEEVAIKSINSVLSLRTTDEIFATLDLAMIDLQDARAKFIKIGSSPSFIKRGDRVIKVQASNLPIGIVQDFEVDVVSEQLKAEDLLIMLTDGVLDDPQAAENGEAWLKRRLAEMETDDPQAVADLLLEDVIRQRSGKILDDMTIVVAKIKHNNPKWKSIPFHSYKTEKGA